MKSGSWNKRRVSEGVMQRTELLLRQSAWMKEKLDSPVVLSSRIRLARNLDKAPFPHALPQAEAKQIEHKLAQVLREVQIGKQTLTYLSLSQLSDIEQQVLIEKHLVSPALINSDIAAGVALAEDHSLAVMVNEEDHLRLQVLLPGNSLRETYHLANELDDALEQELDFAYREAQGYLTSCPTNVGTGLRASVMVHLPALTMTNQVQQVLGALTHLGLAIRGLYGEGSQAFGHIFQISNQITLGKSEEDIFTHLEAVTCQVVEHELKAREALCQQARLMLEDKVWRARGTLQNARLLTSEDAMHLLSQSRLGEDMGILPKSKRTFANLLVNSLPGCLQYILDQELEAGERDERRAQYIRTVFQDSPEVGD